MIKPILDRVVIEPHDAPTEVGVLSIPDSAQKKPLYGKVVAVGEGKTDEAMKLEVENEVLYNNHAGMQIAIDNKPYLIMRQSDVLAVI